MEIGAVTNILENMAGWHKRRLANPIGTFCAHMGIERNRTVHPKRHPMAPDTAHAAAALRYFGGAAMRAA